MNKRKNSLMVDASLIIAIVILASLFFHTTEKDLPSRDMAEDFIRTQLLMPNGGLRTNLKDEEFVPDHATGSDVLSESHGLLMSYSARTGDEELFAKSLGFVEDTLSAGGIISYRYSEDYGPFPVNAAIDDLRIIRALRDGAAAFDDPEYSRLAGRYADQLYESNVVDDSLCDFYDTQYGQVKKTLTLCYADLRTMTLLGEDDERWSRVLERTLPIVQGGYIGDAFPFFASYYDHQTGLYIKGRIETVQSLITAIHLSELALCPSETVAYVKEKVLAGELYGAYDEAGVPLNDIQSTAIYALAFVLGKTNGDRDLQSAAIRHMLRFQITDKESPLYGAFANAATYDVYSFDNLYALLALGLR